MQAAAALDADCIATGHYARVVEVEGHYHLLRGRYTGKEVAATLWPGEKNTVSVHLAAALRDITPGQAAVSYQDATVLGGRIVAR